MSEIERLDPSNPDDIRVAARLIDDLAGARWPSVIAALFSMADRAEEAIEAEKERLIKEALTVLLPLGMAPARKLARELIEAGWRPTGGDDE